METIAYHEAGHAFMACYLGAEVRRVTIEPDRDDGPRRSGDTEVAWRRGQIGEREFCQRGIRVALAGPVAEMLYTGDAFHPALVAEWSADWADAWQLAAPLQPARQRRLKYLERVALELYHWLDEPAPWAAIAELADHLLAHETLEAHQVADLVAVWMPDAG